MNYLNDYGSHEIRTVMFLLFYERLLLLVLSSCHDIEMFSGRRALRLFFSAPQISSCYLRSIFLLLTYRPCPFSFTFLWWESTLGVNDQFLLIIFQMSLLLWFVLSLCTRGISVLDWVLSLVYWNFCFPRLRYWICMMLLTFSLEI